jgi:hypothetical protein
MSRFSMPDVDKGHFSTLNVDEKSEFSTPDVDKKQQGDVATREVEEHNKYFAELYARVFSTLAAYEGQSKFSTHDVDRSDTDEITSTRSKDKYIAELYARVF